MTHEFEVSKELSLDATPEQVWDAIATGPGVDSWFMGRTEIEPREGGRTRMTLGGQTDDATVTSWEPGKRFAYRTDESPEGTFMAIEYLIEGRDGGATSLRMVHSGFLGDDWETEYEALGIGWNMYLHKLVQYLTYFPGRTAKVVTAMRPEAGTREQAWEVFTGELGLSAAPAVGDRARLTVPGLPPIEGAVDYADLPHFLGVRTDDALYRFFHSGAERGEFALLGHHVFAETVDEKETEQAWQSWLNGLPLK